jgi:GT2 family glycosyltransferase
MEKFPRVAIVYLSYHSESYLDDVVMALRNLKYPKDKIGFFVVDNPHPEHGLSTRAIEIKLQSISGIDIPQVFYLPQDKNLGFAGGNNVGIDLAIEKDYEYIYLHNDDGFMATGAVQPLVQVMEQDPSIAVAQSLLLLHPETEYLNNAGNSFHYLGFGFCDEYRTKRKDWLAQRVKDIAYASGAACLVRSSLIKKFGVLDEDFWLYHEDLEWCFRFRGAGYRIVLVKDSVFYHKYKFARSIENFYFMERNRYGVMLIFFKLPTLILLLPMAIVLEIGLWLFAWRGGWIDKKQRVYKYWLKPKNIRIWLQKRNCFQKLRIVNDRYLLSYSSPGVYFQEKSVNTPLLKYFGNPVMTVYYWIVVKGLIRW